ncbi:MAG: flagellar export chaperone FliS [Spirochaetes bacterium]|nr:MAG: flagellar export chaperone FliS [Spirochaetota bacterium]
MSTVNRLNAYKETHIKTASGGRLIIMIYDEAVRQLDYAIEALEGKPQKFDLASNAIIKTQDLITELMVSLDFEKGGEIAQNLFSLYMFFNRQLMDANVKKDVAMLKSVLGFVSDLRDAWHQAINRTSVKGQTPGGINIAG